MIDVENIIANRYRSALVTGGAGFIGSHLVDKLLSLGLHVTSIDDFSSGKRANIDQHTGNSNFRSLRMDVSNFEEINESFEGVDLVFHLACSKNTVCMRDPNRDLLVNAGGTLNVLRRAMQHKVKRVVHASTGSVYGEPVGFPTGENHQLAPVSYYGVSKLAGEKYGMVFHRMHGLEVVVLRYFHVYGPRQDNSDLGGVVSIFCRRAHEGLDMVIYGDGTQVRSFTYVGDVVRINLLAAVEPTLVGQFVNCASGDSITVRELADRVNAIYGNRVGIRYANWRPGDIRRFEVDNSLLLGKGFEFEMQFDQGLRETLSWTKEFLHGRVAEDG